MAKVLSIEIGELLTKVVEADSGKNIRVYNHFSLETPEGVFSDGKIIPDERFIVSLKGQLRDRGIRTNRVIFTINSARIATREIEIPKMKDKLLAEMIKNNSKEYFPVDLKQYDLTFGKNGQTKDGKDKISLLACPKDITESYKVFSEKMGFQIVAIDYVGNSIRNIMTKEYSDETISATIKIDDTATMVTIIEDGGVLLQRSIPYGLSDALGELIDSKVFGDANTAYEVLSLARKSAPDSLYNNGEDKVETGDFSFDPELVGRLREKVSDSLEMLIGSLSRVLDFYVSKNPDKPVEAFHLIGYGADFPYLATLFRQILQIKISVSYDINTVNFDKGNLLDDGMPVEFFAPVGATIYPIPLLRNEKEEEEHEKRIGFKKVHIAAAFLGVFGLALALYSIISYFNIHAENRELQKRVLSLQYAKDAYIEYAEAKECYDYLSMVEEATETNNNSLIEVFDKLSEIMPEKAYISTFSSTSEDMEIEFSMKNKTEATAFITSLRSEFPITSISAVDDTVDENGNHKVTFTITIGFKNEASEEAAE